MAQEGRDSRREKKQHKAKKTFIGVRVGGKHETLALIFLPHFSVCSLCLSPDPLYLLCHLDLCLSVSSQPFGTQPWPKER